MAIIVYLKEVNENGTETYEIKCSQCGKLIARYYVSGGTTQVGFIEDCEHYVWEHFGNYCFSRLPCEKCLLGYSTEYCNEVYKDALKILHDGTSVYVLVPRVVIE